MRSSLIIAAHNEGESLSKTVASCVETCVDLDYEIVVADDASNDGSIEDVRRCFPRVRVVQSEARQGASPTKALGAQEATGDVLVFLDGHTKPEHGAIARLVEDVEALNGDAIITPRVPALDVERWRNSSKQVGHGYSLNLERLESSWLGRTKLRSLRESGRDFYESPALIGCALAVSRELYDKLMGFDPHMRIWGIEDIDFGLKCCLLGHRILHDPEASVGHRFRKEFDNYSVPVEHIVVNQLRMARKHFTFSVWSEWVERCRERYTGSLSEHPEGLWARAWELFQSDRVSVEQERSYLMARRVRDEFWYAQRFALDWPNLHATVSSSRPAIVLFAPSPSPPPVTITFQTDPIKTGFTKPLASSTVSVTTYLVCNPPGAVSDVSLVVAGVDRVEIEIQEVIPETGYLIFRVKGTSETPTNKPNGDTTIEASYQGEVLASIKAIVVVPTAVGEPHPEASGAVPAVNQVADKTTSPTYFGPLLMDEVILWTYYAQ
ncbi:MAG: glycosyltransferase [Pirellulaceae bacterium]